MKITWFGNRTLRLHMAGQIIVWHPTAIEGVASEELESGADQIIAAGQALPKADATAWQPRRAPTALEPVDQQVAVLELGPDAALVEGPGEPPLLLLGGAAPPAGRWSRDAVVLAFTPKAAAAALEALHPKLIVLAVEADDLDAVFDELRAHLGGTALTALEPGLALEV